MQQEQQKNIKRKFYLSQHFSDKHLQELEPCHHRSGMHRCYALGNFAPDVESATALVNYAKLHAESSNGQVPYKSWPDKIKGHFVARIPPVRGTGHYKETGFESRYIN